MGRGRLVWGSALPGVAGPGRPGSVACAASLPREEQGGRTGARFARDAHQPRLASSPRSGLGLRSKGGEKRKNKEKKGRAVRKRRVRLEGAERPGMPGLLLCRSRGVLAPNGKRAEGGR